MTNEGSESLSPNESPIPAEPAIELPVQKPIVLESGAPKFKNILFKLMRIFGRVICLLWRWFKKAFRFTLRWSLRLLVYLLPVLLLLAYMGWRELKTSRWQASYLSKIAAEATFDVKVGASKSIIFPQFGPYDDRLGYTKIPMMIDNLTRNGYVVAKQAEWSKRLQSLVSNGVYPTYREKTRAGITILDRKNTTIYSAYRPERIYESFEEIPKPILNSLLFIENREILDPASPTKNPAIEWDRLGKAVVEKLMQIIYPNINAPGGSTIATQLEKYRHSEEGRTTGIRAKFTQMASASLRAYMYGEETTETRKQIILQYVNSIPLAALPGFGEVNGLGDGLAAWYGRDFDSVNHDLREIMRATPKTDLSPYAASYKEALSLFIAHRRPSYFLLSGVDELNKLIDSHLDLLANEGIISTNLRDAAFKVKLTLRRAAPKPPRVSYLQRKAANAIRTRLLQLTNLPQLYDLDQLDLAVRSTMDNEANEAVTDILKQIKDKESVQRLGLSGARTLDSGDPSKVIYSLTLYERVGNVNLLRVQTDNYDKPFSINEGTRLDLGSTSKLRTLTTYLDIIGQLFDKYHEASVDTLKTTLTDQPDPLTEFVVNAMLKNPNLSLNSLLDQAMNRTYSASPGEAFFTGGGMHTFVNFNKDDNGRNATLDQSLTSSINLPFIRLMRDIVRHTMYRMGLSFKQEKSTRGDEVRMKFLKKFADQEGSHFVALFYRKYNGKSVSEILPSLVQNYRASARHATVMFRFVYPQASVNELASFLSENLKSTDLSSTLVEKLYHEFEPGKFNLNDQGYLARVHPLELWVVKYMVEHPSVTLATVLKESEADRQETYKWLFSAHRRAQDVRIRTLIEVEAFHEIFKQWKKVGYPFNSMVPSYASAIGSSGDRPAALAELVGIILNDGMKYPLVRLEELHMGANTPYETLISRNTDSNSGVRVLKPEVARTLRAAMANVVEKGTARRVFQAYKRSDGKAYVIGGKTGTGDHRHETFGPGGNLIASRVVNRTATFAFYIGDRFFGVVSAHVPGPEAANFHFTSALAAELLKVVGPSLIPIIESEDTQLGPDNSVIKTESVESSGAAAPVTPVSTPKVKATDLVVANATPKISPAQSGVSTPAPKKKVTPEPPPPTKKPLPIVIAPPA